MDLKHNEKKKADQKDDATMNLPLRVLTGREGERSRGWRRSTSTPSESGSSPASLDTYRQTITYGGGRVLRAKLANLILNSL